MRAQVLAHPALRRRAVIGAALCALLAAVVSGSSVGGGHRTARVHLLGMGGMLNAAFTGAQKMYLRYPGVTTGSGSQHTGDIQISSFQWGVGRGISSPTGASADRESSAPSVSEIVVTKASDKYTLPLIKQVLVAASTAAPTVTAKLYVVRSNAQGPLETLEFHLFRTVIASSDDRTPTQAMKMHGSAAGTSESITLNYTKIEITYSAKGNPPTKACYDLATAKKC
jgi:type VI secretion system secreted protein Hcp